MTIARRVAAACATVAIAVLVATASAAPLPWHRDAIAMLRLSWTARPEWLEQCRAATEEELAQLGPHMRQRLLCEGTPATYRLRIAVDDSVVAEHVVRGGGFRHDRPMHVLVDQTVAPGRRHVRVSLERREASDTTSRANLAAPAAQEDTGLFAGRAAREIAERARRTAAALPPLLVLDTVLDLAPRRVTLVRYDTDRRRLEVSARDNR